MIERTPKWAKKPPQKCGTCKWLRPRSDGKPFHHANSYACLYAFPKILWPASMHPGHYSSPIGAMERPIKGYMQPGDGKDCPCWERKAPTPEASAEARRAVANSNPVVQEKDDG